MTDRFRLTISQLNPTLGNFKENISKAVTSWKIGKAEKANLVALPEMFIYLPSVRRGLSHRSIRAAHYRSTKFGRYENCHSYPYSQLRHDPYVE